MKVRLREEESARVQTLEVEQWLIWAKEQADRFDPLTKSPPSILDEVV